MKVGILFPMSKMYPGIGTEFMDGLNAFLKENNLKEQVEIVKEGIGFGGEEKDVYLKVESLLISQDVDVLIAFIDEKVLHIIHPLLQATGKIMILVNAGANYPLSWIPQPSVIRLNLQHAFCCWLAGANAAKSGNGKAALATTYYDCGYLHAAAMTNRFMECNGTIMYNYINNQAYNESFDINQLIAFLLANQDCKNLLCLFDKQPAELFYKLLNGSAAGRELHLFCSPMMLQSIVETGYTEKLSFSIEGYLPWYKNMDTPENNFFTGKLTKPASMFSLLGWETAMILGEMLHYNNPNADEMISLLTIRPLNSPRGELKLDPETQYYLAPLASCRMDQGSSAPVVEWITGLDEEWRTFTAKATEGHVTGWTNTYLCY